MRASGPVQISPLPRICRCPLFTSIRRTTRSFIRVAPSMALTSRSPSRPGPRHHHRAFARRRDRTLPCPGCPSPVTARTGQGMAPYPGQARCLALGFWPECFRRLNVKGGRRPFPKETRSALDIEGKRVTIQGPSPDLPSSASGLLRDSAHVRHARLRYLRCCPGVAVITLGRPPRRARGGRSEPSQDSWTFRPLADRLISRLALSAWESDRSCPRVARRA